ncbi:hypothetical protein [Ramlibacter sp.]|uniref:hypothetical protein n=1 Tax=Ramlibacter sp. TaxID=1917967 RepID=UPI0017E07747|nr:hypothetical protein [Ramlibacter sp.]MBA2676049.1 hypothetical protein [Ramlibacter sp.]
MPRLPRSLRLLAAFACAGLVGVAPTASAAPPYQGLWCGTGLLHEFRLKLAPGADRNEVNGVLARKDRVRQLHGSFDGRTLRTQATKYGALVLTLAGNELRITGGDGPLALAQGTSFRRASGDACGG